GCSSTSSSASPTLQDAGADAPVDATDVTPTATWTSVASTPGGSARWAMPIVYIPPSKTFVGVAGDGTYLEGAKQDAWSFSPGAAAWTKLPADTGAPAPRYCHCVTFLPDQNQLLVVGGRDDTTALAPNAWTLDLATNAWTQVQGDAPPGVI